MLHKMSESFNKNKLNFYWGIGGDNTIEYYVGYETFDGYINFIYRNHFGEKYKQYSVDWDDAYMPDDWEAIDDFININFDIIKKNAKKYAEYKAFNV